MSAYLDKRPPELDAWLDQQPASERAALQKAWQLAGTYTPDADVPVPDADRIAQVQKALTALAIPEPLSDDLAEATASFSRDERNALHKAWHLAGLTDDASPAPDAARIDQVWATLEQAASSGPSRARDRAPRRAKGRAPRSRVRSRWTLGTAALLIVGCLAVWLWSRPTTISVPYGQTLAVVLPDGSQVELNSGSRLTYEHGFGRTHRRSHLAGEAFFDVVSAASPFTVETFNAQVTVLGTHFNVRAWPDDRAQETTVAVEEGRVQVETRVPDTTAIVLNPGELSVVRASAPPSNPIAAAWSDPMAWRTGAFAFFDASFGEIFNEIERRFDVSITAPEALRARPRTFILHEASHADSLLNALCQSSGLRYRATAGGFEVYEP